MNIGTGKGAWFSQSDSPQPTRPRGVEELWHYTDHHGLVGILGSNEIWATSHLGMNDTSELNYGVESVRAVWDAMQSLLTDVAPRREVAAWLASMEARIGDLRPFLLSASTNGDMVNNWNLYGRGSDGYAIRFDPQVEFRLIGDGPKLYQPDVLPVPYWLPIHYGTPNLDFFDCRCAARAHLRVDRAGAQYLSWRPHGAMEE